METLETLTAEVEAELGRLSMTAPWAEQVPYLVQLSGLGVLAAMTMLAAIGDIARFPTAKDLVGYAGLGAGVHDSGQTHQTGHITKQGRRELRGAMVEAAWVAVEHHPQWKEQFTRLSGRLGAQKAIVAIALQSSGPWRRLPRSEVLHEAPQDVALEQCAVFDVAGMCTWRSQREQRPFAGAQARQSDGPLVIVLNTPHGVDWPAP